jgi:hypothetical protein
MDRASHIRRRATKPAEVHEGNPISEIDRKVYQLISSGFLPSADTVTKDGKPAWTFESISDIAGCRESELAELLRHKGARYSMPSGARH